MGQISVDFAALQWWDSRNPASVDYDGSVLHFWKTAHCESLKSERDGGGWHRHGKAGSPLLIRVLCSKARELRVGFSDIHPTLYVISPWLGQLGSVLFGPWRTGLALPWTGMDYCPRILLSCFRAKTSPPHSPLSSNRWFYWPTQLNC